MIQSNPSRHSELKSALNISAAETTRHLRRMAEGGIIEKTTDATFRITPYGRMLLDEMENLAYLNRHRDFFNTHDMSSIPQELFSLMQMSRSGLLTGSMPVMGKLYDITNRASAFLWCMTPDPVEPFIRHNVDRLESGVELQLIYESNAGIPSDFIGNRAFPLEVRTLDDITMSIWLNEREGVLILPDPFGKIDYSVALHGNDASFLRWTSLIFENYWLEGRNVNL